MCGLSLLLHRFNNAASKATRSAYVRIGMNEYRGRLQIIHIERPTIINHMKRKMTSNGLGTIDNLVFNQLNIRNNIFFFLKVVVATLSSTLRIYDSSISVK